MSTRTAFEAWAIDKGYLLTRHTDGNYTATLTERAWAIWRAATATVESK